MPQISLPETGHLPTSPVVTTITTVISITASLEGDTSGGSQLPTAAVSTTGSPPVGEARPATVITVATVITSPVGGSNRIGQPMVVTTITTTSEGHNQTVDTLTDLREPQLTITDQEPSTITVDTDQPQPSLAEDTGHTQSDAVGETSQIQPKTFLTNDLEAESWGDLYDGLTRYDKDFYDKLQDETGNLLVFAGLFSAVVTGFSVEAARRLDKDYSLISAQLLQLIAYEVSSFKISGELINSTLLPTGPSGFDWDLFESNFITVNKLWLYSLTLSIASAFYAITMQQSLRNLSLPSHLSIRESVRRRQLRYEAVMKLRLPFIIDILGFCLQCSTLLFLFGLMEFYATLDYESDIIPGFGTFVALLLGPQLYTLSFYWALPLSPFRHPLVPVGQLFLSAAFKATRLLFGVVILGVILVALVCLWVARLLIALLKYCLQTVGGNTPTLSVPQCTAVKKIRAFSSELVTSSRLSYDVANFWERYEDRSLQYHAPTFAQADFRAVRWALNTIPEIRNKLLRRLMLRIRLSPSHTRSASLGSWPGFTDPDDNEQPIDRYVMTEVDRCFADDFKDDLLQILSTTFADDRHPPKDGMESRGASVALLMLTWIVNANMCDASLHQKVVLQAFLISNNHRCDISEHERYAAICLFECRVKYPLGVEETMALIRLVTHLSGCMRNRRTTNPLTLASVYETVFALAATALFGLREHRPGTEESWKQVTDFLKALQLFVQRCEPDIAALNTAWLSSPRLHNTTTPASIQSMSQSLLHLDTSQNPDVETARRYIGRHLRFACEHRRLFSAAMKDLRKLYPNPDGSPGLKRKLRELFIGF